MIDNLNDLYLKKCSFAIEENGIKKVKKWLIYLFVIEKKQCKIIRH
jgi:hypothetical protein